VPLKLNPDSSQESDHQVLPCEFLRRIKALESSYLKHTDPILQSGFGGGAERWRLEREPILDAITSDGDFLDIGCANGYLLESLITWSIEKGIIIIPWGLDIGPRLIELARGRFPQHRDHFFIANAWDWIPPRKFQYVYTLFDMVPENRFSKYVGKLLYLAVERGGTLIIGAYGSYTENYPAPNIAKILKDMGYRVSESVSVGTLPAAQFAWINT
jgi:SAM-dependent methyltransferase